MSKMQKEDLKKLLNLRKEYLRLREKFPYQFISVETDGIHMRESTFRRLFSEYTATNRKCNTYPIGLETMHEGEKFYCLLPHVSEDDNEDLYDFYKRVKLADPIDNIPPKEIQEVSEYEILGD